MRRRQAQGVEVSLVLNTTLASMTSQILETANSERETVQAKYVVGCDGAHSWIRRRLKIPLEGERTNKHFGVVDIVPLTDFRAYCR